MGQDNGKVRGGGELRDRHRELRRRLEAVYHSPIRLLLIIAAAIFVSESFVMLLLYALPSLTGEGKLPLASVFLDSALLVVLLSPVLYFFLFRPLIHLLRDIADAEDGLVAERDSAQRYLDIAGAMIVVLDARGRVVLINRRGCEILGYEEAAINGKDWFENFIPGRARAEVRDAFERLKAGEGAPEYFENPVLTGGGAERVILWHNRALSEDGRFSGTISSGEDVTEQKKAAEAQRSAEARYRMVHSTAFDGIIISDESDRIIECNPSAERIFGYESGGLRGMPLAEIMPEKYRERHARGLERFLATRVSSIQGRVLELEGLKKDGTVVPIELILGNFTIDSGIYFTGTIRDISERRRAEKERALIQSRLNQAQKMEAIGRLAGGIAHDFNNVLTAIRGNAELTLEDAGGDPAVRQRIEEIILTIQHASRLTRQLLLFSRGQPFELAAIDVNKTVENLLKMITRIIGEDISVTTDLSPGLWTVMADETSIEQVVVNLAVNARDAMPGGGVLAIKTGNVTLGEADRADMTDARPGDAVCLTVEDNGIGMEREVLERIFEPFFTTKDAEKESGGTGFGLSVVYGIVKKHGGWINVRSSPGAGSSFRIFLPAAKGAEKEAQGEEPAGARPSGGGEGILVVEAEERVREFARRALTGGGYKVFAAASTEEATAVIDKNGPAIDVLIADASLPGSGAGALIAYAHSRGPAIQVILTGSLMDMKGLWHAGADRKVRYLQKPFSLAGLLRAVSTTMEQARLRP